MKFKPIGVIHTPFKRVEDVPVNANNEVKAEVEIFEPYSKGLKNIEEKGYLVLVYYFHKERRESLLASYKGKEWGIFATRFAYRPNRIGLTAVKILERKKNILRVEGIDILDGTPLLDIKSIRLNKKIIGEILTSDSPHKVYLTPPSGIYEPEVVAFYESKEPYKIAVDIGAGVGFHSRRLAKLSKKVIAIEPVNALEDMPKNVKVHKVAIGETKRKKKIYVSELKDVRGLYNASFYEGFFGRARKEKMIEIVPLNNIVKKADFLKVDVEGYEPEVLEDAEILKNVKYIVIELHLMSNPREYQSRIFNQLRDFNVLSPQYGRYVSEKDIPLPNKRQHLFCTRKP